MRCEDTDVMFVAINFPFSKLYEVTVNTCLIQVKNMCPDCSVKHTVYFISCSLTSDSMKLSVLNYVHLHWNLNGLLVPFLLSLEETKWFSFSRYLQNKSFFLKKKKQ